MPPQRTRNPQEEMRSDGPGNATREKYTGIFPSTSAPKARRSYMGSGGAIGSGVKEIAPISQAVPGPVAGGEEMPKIDWSTFDTSTLLAYRDLHQLDVPAAFTSPYNERMLSRPGIGQLSPTMARHQAGQRLNKDRLAMAVRKDFNAAMISEPDIISSFLYAVHNQGKAFRMKFGPDQPK